MAKFSCEMEGPLTSVTRPNWKPFKSKHQITDQAPLQRWTRLFGSVVALLVIAQLILQTVAFSITTSDLPKVDRSLGVEYQESVFYSPVQLITHPRARREVGHRAPLQLHLHSKSRDFHLNLEEDNSVFHPEVVIENSESPVDYDTKRLFVGHLQDEPGSFVEGLLTSEGHFDGVISTATGQEFHVEPSNRYTPFSQESDGPVPPGVIYERESVQWPSVPPLCASHQLHLRNLTQSVDMSTVDMSGRSESGHRDTAGPTSDLYSGATDVSVHSRPKRYVIEPQRKTCMLFLQADHLFYRHLGSEEAVVNMMARHIQRVNEIYKATDFDGDGQPDGISFMIKRIKVYTSKDATANTSVPYKYNGDFQVIQFLETFSEGDYESFCLAYMFTFRDFEGGTLGLAWTGDLKNAGGVCERKGHFRGGLKSLNTGIITLLNYGKVVVPAVSYVTLAHEIGHNFGSPHDPDSDRECVPGGRDGNFIMYARATAGDQKNNQRFSPCSLRSIGPVLTAKARNIHGCFSEPQRGICGNREVEEGEECDCGWEEDCRETCCWPMRTKYDKGEVPCTLRKGKECSPSQGVCCTSQCSLKVGDKCRDDNGCRHTAFCDGYGPACPPSVHKPNRTVCQEEQNVCFMGECTGSICLAYGLESCQCSPQPWDSVSKLCELCCKKPGDSQPCLSSFEWNEAPFDVPDLFAKPGSPCKNYTGYCDAYRSCREVDPSGPLATLRNLLLADEGLTAIAHWIDTHWYAVISFVALLIVMMVLTAKLCGKQAKKKLRKITILHSNVGAIQVERSYWDEGGEHVVHPAAVRKKIPLRKKIREKKIKSKSKSGRPGSVGKRQDGVPAAAKENKGPRYGTLWRRRRGERVRLALKTDTLNNNGADGLSPMEQTFDLVQLTPLTSATVPSVPSSSAASPIYPVLTPTPVPGPSKVSPGAVPSSSGSRTNLNPNSPTSGGLPVNANPSTSTSSSSHHQYEPKTAILPSPGRRKRTRKRASSSRSHSSRVPNPTPGTRSGRKVVKSGSRIGQSPTGSPIKRQPTSTPVSPQPVTISHPKPTTPKAKVGKKSLQIVYTPPFSVKVVHVEAPTTTSGSTNPKPEMDPKVPRNTLNVLQIPLPSPPGQPQPNPGSLTPIVESPAVLENDEPPPPYSSFVSQPETVPSHSTSRSKVDGKVRKSNSHSTKGPGNDGKERKSSKVKSSGSFLQRRKKGRNEKSELRVLIPPTNLDEETEGTTPIDHSTPH